MGDGTVAGPWNSVKIVELVLNSLGIVLTVSRLLVRQVCENDGHPDTWRISNRTVVDKRLWGIPSGVLLGNHITRDCENVAKRRWRIGIAGR